MRPDSRESAGLRRRQRWQLAILAPVTAALSGCVDLQALRLPHPSVAPEQQPAATLSVDASRVEPMYHRMFAIDLPTVIRVAMAGNLDIQAAQQRVEASQGAYEASIGGIFPSLTPSITAQRLKGVLGNAAGGFSIASVANVVPAAALEWVINPGQVAYDLIAARRQLEASAQQQQAVEQETARSAAVQYYALVLAQARVAATREALDQALELVRIERLKLQTGTGLPGNEMQAEAAFAAAQEAELNALNGFYDASVALAVTLHLDATTMLVPHIGTMAQTTLVREDMPIDAMLVTAVRYRPDLQAVRSLYLASQADTGSTLWGGLGPQVVAQRTFFGAPPANQAADTLYTQQTYSATVGFNLSAEIFGRIKTATANARIAGIDVDAQLDKVRAAVVSAHQASITAAKLIPIADREVSSAKEALRLTQENRKNGTGLTIDVLQADAAAVRHRLTLLPRWV
jgi:outer membrane protein TolC